MPGQQYIFFNKTYENNSSSSLCVFCEMEHCVNIEYMTLTSFASGAAVAQ